MTGSSRFARLPGISRAVVGERPRRHRMRLRVATARGGAFTVNVSLGGYCTEQLRVLRVGTLLEGTISLQGHDLPFVGRVAWTLPGEHRLNQLGRMGVQFERIGPGFSQRLELCAARSPIGRSQGRE